MARRYNVSLFFAYCSTLVSAFFNTTTQAAVPLKAAGISPPAIVRFGPLNGGATILYDQTDNASGDGVAAQDFESFSDPYDSEAADDFVVPAQRKWIVSGVNIVGTISVAPAELQSVRVWFYADNSAFPAASAICSYDIQTPGGVPSGNLEIELPTPCTLEAGNHWVAIQAVGNFSSMGQFFWSSRSTQSNNASVWRNPPDGFGTGCINWSRQMACIGSASPDFLFQIEGSEEPVPTAIPIFTPLTGFGLSIAIASLGALSLRSRRNLF